MTRDAIVRLSARLGRRFTYGELNAELEAQDGVKIDGRGYAGALEAVAQHIRNSEPLWTTMVVNAETGQPGEGLWKANPNDRRYADAARLSDAGRAAWLEAQRGWCIAAARVLESPLEQGLRGAEAEARAAAETALIDLLLADQRHGKGGTATDPESAIPAGSLPSALSGSTVEDHRRTQRVGLVGCTKSKRAIPSPARDLYDPSTLFRGRRAYVERTCGRWFVLSALYGLVDSDRVIEPYDVTLKRAPIAERRAWSERIVAALRERLGDLQGVEFECHAGSEYLDFGVADGLRSLGATVVVPTEGLLFGEQLAFYARVNPVIRGDTRSSAAVEPTAIPPRPDRAAVLPPAPVSDADQAAVVSSLLAFGRSLEGGTSVAIVPDPEADELVHTDAFAFLLGVIFDQGIQYERAWRAPLDLRERLGHLAPARVVADPEAVRQAVMGPPSLHRYVNNMAAWIVRAASRVIDVYDGDAERIWNDRPTAEVLRARFERFDGIGQKKAAMAVEILERQRGVAITHLEGSDIAFDVHVRRVFLRTGLADRDDRSHMIARARRLNPERPGALDYPAWWIGHEWCRPTAPLCGACPLADSCPRLIDRAIGVSSA